MSGGISADRIAADIEAIARFTETPGVCDRPSYSRSWAQARDYVIGHARQVGCDVRIDKASNVHIRPSTLGWNTPAWLSGSHIDSVPTGGRFDGVMGVVVPLEVLRTSANAALELVIFAEEEGTTFQLGMIGSRLWSGTLAPAQLEGLVNAQGETVWDAGRAHGLDREALSDTGNHMQAERYIGMVEIHAEQGRSLWDQGLSIAFVDRINGRRQFRIAIDGQENHAGSTGMRGRRDALAGAAQLVTEVERIGQELDQKAPYSVMTVGQLTVEPGAINVIPGRSVLTADLRAQDDSILDRGETELTAALDRACSPRGLLGQTDRTEAIPPSPLHNGLVSALERAAGMLGQSVPRVPSGALHDAAVLAPFLPTAMVFVASKDGISHNPDEFSRTEDIASAARVLAQLVTNGPVISVRQVNTLPEDEVLPYCQGFYEHSAWIPRAALARRPFETLQDFHRACTQVVADASTDQQIELIQAHPDLVGNLAKEGRLTAESTSEQAAAGLTRLTPGEAEAFDRLNHAYRERFGFPFVICARENRKDAILDAFPTRLEHDRPTEIRAALEQIAQIAWLRMSDAILDEDQPVPNKEK